MNTLKFVLSASLFILLASTLAFAAEGKQLPVDDAEKLVLKVSENGFEPNVLKFHEEDGSVFVVNSSKSSLLTLSVDFKGRKMHCASGNMSYVDGILKSNSPIAPKDFALFCLPEKGHYDVVAYGVTGKPVQASLEVE